MPVLEDDGFALYESAAIVEYIEDKHPGEPRLFASGRSSPTSISLTPSSGSRRRLFTKAEERSPERNARACEDIRRDLALWDTALTGDWLAGPLSAVDFTLYPELALVLRIAHRDCAAAVGEG